MPGCISQLQTGPRTHPVGLEGYRGNEGAMRTASYSGFFEAVRSPHPESIAGLGQAILPDVALGTESELPRDHTASPPARKLRNPNYLTSARLG